MPVLSAVLGCEQPDNSFIERFNGTMRDEVLLGEEFETVLEARVVITAWLDVYNRRRPHRGLGIMAPLAFAAAQNVVPR